MRIFTEISALKDYLASKERRGVGFVPTMGALHAGHLSLVGRARAECDTVVVSLFVNPTQFNDPRDLERYPRTPAEDIALLEEARVNALFMPSVGEIYPAEDERIFDFGDLDKVMEGATRPGHFNGVAQVVSRLFEIVDPARAYFGEKDFQQVAVVRALVEMMGSDVEIVACPTLRESDGLAMSSRNALLTPGCRAAAPRIYAVLCEGVAKKGEMSPCEVERWVAGEIDRTEILATVYFSIVDAATLQPVERWNDAPALRGCIAVRAGEVRLIDNIAY